jgi:aryl-alcohol dehydrogenase-like predicted oxidoreductase
MISRRKFLGTSLGAGAALALAPELLRAHQQSAGTLLQRAVPSSGEMLPVVSFGPRRETDDAAMKEILRTLAGNGGKVVDVLHGGPGVEQAGRTAAAELGITDKFFWTTPLSVAGLNSGPVLPGAIRKADPAAVRAAMDEKFAAFKVPRIDLVMVGANADIPTHLAVLQEMKKEGRVRYIGVHDLATPPYPTDATFARLESIMREEPIDFVATDYCAGWRGVEGKILPLAQERKIGFMAYFTFDRGRLLKRASGTPLPEWAAEFDARTWAQFFLKYVVSHPAVTVARTGTTKAAHMLDNIGGGIGRLPNEAMRRRMAEFVDSLPEPPKPPAPPPTPGRTTITSEQAQQQLANQAASAVVLSAAILDRYVGEYRHVAAGTMATVRRDGDKLLVNVQGSGRPEISFVAHSETRFVSGLFTLEFQLDGQGKVTGATWEQGPQRIPLERQ